MDKVLIVASFVYRKEWLASGVPPLQKFYDNLPNDDKFWCHHVLHEILK